MIHVVRLGGDECTGRLDPPRAYRFFLCTPLWNTC